MMTDTVTLFFSRPARHMRLWRSPAMTLGLIALTLLLLLAAFAPWLAPFDPNLQQIDIRLAPPSHAHWLGTDGFGRDLTSRVLVGTRPTLLLVSLVLLFSVPFGLTVGMVAGLGGGALERVLMRLTDMVLALPSLVLALAMVAVLGPGLFNGALALALTAWPAYARELGWAASFLAVMTAYIRVLGGACGLAQDFRGPMAKPQRMAVMTAACLAAIFDSRALALGLMLVIAGSLVTAALRLRRIVRQLESRT